MRRLRIALCLTVVGTLVSGCLLPPMDPDLSRAYKTAAKMTLEAEIGPFYADRNLVGFDIFFLPSKAVERGVYNGVVVAESASGVELGYVRSTGTDSYIDYWGHYDISNSDSDRYNYQVHMHKVDTAIPGYDIFTLHDAAATDNPPYDYRRLQHDDPGGIADNNSTQWTTIITAAGTKGPLAGLGFHDEDDITNETIAILEHTGGSGPDFTETRLLGATYSTFGAITQSGGITMPLAATNGFFYYNSVTATRIFSSYADGDYLTYRWDTMPPVAADLLPLTDRVDQLLTNDLLYHRGDKEDTVYDRNGKKKYEFASGDLYLAYERFVGGVPTLFYTLVFFERAGGGDDEMHIRVYSIPTADLGDLE